MDKTPSITNADDAKLCELISRARERVLLVGPGVSEDVARVLQEAWTRLGPEAVDVILDVDPEVCRLGYGTLEGLKIVRAAATRAGSCVSHQPGIRIGVLICDQTTLIFSPTPLLIEAGSSQPDHPNAIQLGSPPEQVARELGLGPNRNMERLIGLDPVQQQQVEDVETNLAECPPAKFDLARRVRVFTSRFQFVELEVTGCFISRKKVPIPSQLIGLANSPDVQSQFRAHFNLINKTKLEVCTKKGRVITEASIQKQRQQLVHDFLIPIKGYGNVVLRANKDKLLKVVRKLRAAVKVFQCGITEDLQQHMTDNATALVEALLPAVIRNPPDAYTKFDGPGVSEDLIRKFLASDIESAFGTAEDLVRDMKVTLVFKDVAYESLVDKKFLEVARKAMPNVEFLHEEYEAAQAVSH